MVVRDSGSPNTHDQAGLLGKLIESSNTVRRLADSNLHEEFGEVGLDVQEDKWLLRTSARVDSPYTFETSVADLACHGEWGSPNAEKAPVALRITCLR